jgi:hypothetical protein
MLQCERFRSEHVFSEADEKVWAVSHWQRVNPFRDGPAGQHYLLLERNMPRLAASDFDALYGSISLSLDFSYRDRKRALSQSVTKRNLVFHVMFNQDWPFLRSLMDVWPADKVHVLVRADNITEPHLGIMANYLRRAGVSFSLGRSIEEGKRALAESGGSGPAMFITATEGLPFTHIHGSMVGLEARRLGMTTIALQHGMNLLPRFTPAAEFVAVWDDESATRYSSFREPNASWDIKVTGSPKFLDTAIEQRLGFLSERFGTWVDAFHRKILVGLGLHWPFHTYGVESTFDWVRRISANNPSTLFLIRPHVYDSTIYTRLDLLNQPNVLLLDEAVLLAMDISVSRILRGVDGVITAYSTLVLDALVAGAPLAVLPHGQDKQVVPARLPSSGSAAPYYLTDEEWMSGRIPASIAAGRSASPNHLLSAPSWSFYSRLDDLAEVSQPDVCLDAAEQRVRSTFLEVSAGFTLNQHPDPIQEQVRAAHQGFLKDQLTPLTQAGNEF